MAVTLVEAKKSVRTTAFKLALACFVGVFTLFMVGSAVSFAATAVFFRIVNSLQVSFDFQLGILERLFDRAASKHLIIECSGKLLGSTIANLILGLDSDKVFDSSIVEFFCHISRVA